MKKSGWLRVGLVAEFLSIIGFSGIGFLSTAGPALAGTALSEPALFARCYSHLTGKPVPIGSQLQADVRAGRKKALDACFSLLDRAGLTTQGQLADPNDPEAVAILNRLYNYHRSLFPIGTQDQLPHYSIEYSSGTGDSYDITEPALAMTKVILSGQP